MPYAKVKADMVFQALGDSTRRAMVERLCDGPLSVSRLAEPFDMTLTAITQHLQILEQCGLVRSFKAGRVRTCRLERTGFDMLQNWIERHREIWERRLDRLGEVLEE
ncbi:MAG: winged helix-turn-helix transcriptional regulator [Planctomycetia bacterium]|nr:winged helix-turn-helix transcriptional regulator [Planctomycetia bacterium]